MGMVAGFHRLKFPYPRLDADAQELLRNQWAAFADRITLQMAAITILYAVLNLVVPWTRIGVPAPPMGFFAQLFLPSQMVYLTLALTLDGGQSVVGRYLRKAATQWLGQMSFALYLVHFPVMQMVGFITRGHVTLPPVLKAFSLDPDCCASVYWAGEACHMRDTGVIDDTAWTAEEIKIFNTAIQCQADRGKTMRNPAWTIPVTLAVSLLLAALLERFVERPCRQLLRSHPRKS